MNDAHLVMDGASGPPNGMQNGDNQPLDSYVTLALCYIKVAFVAKFLQSYYKNTDFQNIFSHNANIFEKLAFRLSAMSLAW